MSSQAPEHANTNWHQLVQQTTCLVLVTRRLSVMQTTAGMPQPLSFFLEVIVTSGYFHRRAALSTILCKREETTAPEPQHGQFNSRRSIVLARLARTELEQNTYNRKNHRCYKYRAIVNRCRGIQPATTAYIDCTAMTHWGGQGGGGVCTLRAPAAAGM